MLGSLLHFWMPDVYKLWIFFCGVAALCTIIMIDNNYNVCEIVKNCVNCYHYLGIDALA